MYRHCRRITAHHGRTYYLASRLLPESRRSAIYALYAFARTVDDLVDIDVPIPGRSAADPAGVLDAIEADLRTALAHPGPPTAVASDGELARVLPVFVDTVERFRIPAEYFFAFLDSMRMDVSGTANHRTRYRTMAELREYMYGSAVVIGLQMLPVLGTTVPLADAAPHAAALGEAFQLTNFLRDIGEDLVRGRVYLPADELAAFGVDTGLLEHSWRTGVPDPRISRALAHLIATTRSLYRYAEPGLDMLDRRVQPGIRTAFVLYSRILDEIEQNGYQVLDRRVQVPTRHRLAVAVPQLLRSGVVRMGPANPSP